VNAGKLRLAVDWQPLQLLDFEELLGGRRSVSRLDKDKL